MLKQLDSQLTASKDSHGSWIPKTVVSTGLGREEWDCGVGLAEQELGPREREEGGSTFRERGGPKAWGNRPRPGQKGQYEVKSGETGLDTQSRSGV